jgi:putative alpha-1,2-mannosidase
MASLITKLGGPANFISRLKFLHSSGLLYVGDEQAFLPTFQFHYGGRPGLSSKQSHAYIPSKFNSSTYGLAGNDDSGAMGSFIFLSMLGLWPVAGQDVYLINPPYFKEISMKNRDTGKTATIRNLNFDPSYNAIYIQSAMRDGKPWTKNWIGYDFFIEGGLLEFSTWGTTVPDLPPSLSPYQG